MKSEREKTTEINRCNNFEFAFFAFICSLCISKILVKKCNKTLNSISVCLFVSVCVRHASCVCVCVTNKEENGFHMIVSVVFTQ